MRTSVRGPCTARMCGLQQAHGKVAVLAGDVGLVPTAHGLNRSASVHHKSRHLGWPTQLKSTELTAALSQRRGERRQSSERFGRRGPSAGTTHADARQALTYLRLAGLPSSEALFEVIGGYSGVPDHFNEVLHAGRNRRRLRFSCMRHRSVGVCSSSMQGQPSPRWASMMDETMPPCRPLNHRPIPRPCTLRFKRLVEERQ